MAEQTQAVAGLRVMAAVAKADGHLADEERKQIAEALAELAPDVSVDSILSEDFDLDGEIAKITDPDVRAATYRAAVMLSVADGEHHAEEDKVLAKLRAAYGLTDEGTGVAKLFEGQAALAPLEHDQATRDRDVKRDVLGHSMMAAALGANPLPLVSFVTEVGVFYLQGRLVRNLAYYYGYDVSMKHAFALMASTFGLGVARMAIVQMVKFVPVWGSVVGGATAFTTTYALGETIRRHFEKGGDLASLTKKEAKKAYEEIKKSAAKAEYEKAKPEIEKKAKEKGPELEALAKDIKEGKADEAAIAASLEDLKDQ
ncbi:MAG: DUF533 domain-containing protein [Polyangiaceae bacterium]|jgi:uncharacterized protein (DUF697 family)/tellurite resistance protein|nr:DUF533 domain-containing protein [Polyangiaceae bacterium]MBK8938382.1 DUF533 domain-containing protein [Polyangiaceae bacterium]